jgi:hypothetical protein
MGMKQRILKIAKWTGIVALSLVLLISGGLYMFKDDIIKAVVSEVNKYLKTPVNVAKIDLSFWSSFPNLSVDFKHVFIADSFEGATKNDTLIYTDRIRLKFNPMDIWREEYKVHEVEVSPGALHMKIRKDGSVNYDIFAPSTDTSAATAFKFELEQVRLNGLRFNYDNKATAQNYKSHVEEMTLSGNFTESQFNLRAASRMQVQRAKSGEVTLLSNRAAAFDLELQVDTEKGAVYLPQATVYISNLPFEVKGGVTKEEVKFNVRSKDIQLTDLASNLAVSEMDEIRRFDGKGKIYFNLEIQGGTATTDPTNIDCTFGINGGELTEPESKMRLRAIHLDGEYSNRGGSEKEFLKLKDVRFTTVGGPFSGELLLTKFNTPRFQGKAKGNIDMNVVHRLFRIPYIETAKGNVSVKTDFDVHAELQANETLDYLVDKCEGDVEMHSVFIKLIDDKRTFSDMNGRLYLRNDEAGIDKVRAKIGNSDFEIDGVFKNIVEYLKNKGSLNANVQLRSGTIEVEDLGTTTKEEKVVQDGRQFLLPNDIEGTVFLDVKKLSYEGHTFKQFKGNLLVGNRKLHFPIVTLINADAEIMGSLTIEERSPEILHLTTQVASNSIQFKQLFREWNNFRQDMIGEKNIFGKAQAKVYFEAPFDLRSGVISKSIKAEIFLRISDGRLKDVEAFRSITESLRTSSAAKLAVGPKHINGLEKKLLDLKFETLENTFIIRNGRMEIPKMEIRSNALDIELTGTHTFEDLIDYRFAFRFRELKDQQRDSEFGEILDDGTGMRVYMRMHGPLNNPTIVWDKQAKKEQAKENREEAKQDAKAILKTEFGFFKNDTTVQIYQEQKKPKEQLILDFGEQQNLPTDSNKKPEKDSKLKNKLKIMKEQSDKEKAGKVEFEVE